MFYLGKSESKDLGLGVPLGAKVILILIFLTKE